RSLLGRRLLRRRGLRRCRLLRTGLRCAFLRGGRRLLGGAVGAVRARQDTLEPLSGGLFVQVLRVHELAGEDLLRLDEHLLLAGGEALFAIAKRQVPHDLGELEDVAGLHLVAVVLEAAVPVLRHLRAAASKSLDDDLDHVLADHLSEPDLLGVLRRDVDGHIVVQDLDRQVLTLLAEHLALFLLYDRTCPVVRIHHLVADFVQARPFPSYLTATPAGRAAGGVRAILTKHAANRHVFAARSGKIPARAANIDPRDCVLGGGGGPPGSRVPEPSPPRRSTPDRAGTPGRSTRGRPCRTPPGGRSAEAAAGCVTAPGSPVARPSGRAG